MAGISDVFGRLNLGARAVERPRPDPQGADVRPDEQRGQSRRGRQGVLVVPRRRAEQRLAALALPLPAGGFPYEGLLEENARRSKLEPEYELLDTGIFDDDRYWIVEVHYAKADPTDILMRVTVRNAGPEAAELHVLPTIWFRNKWSFDAAGRGRGCWPPPTTTILASHPDPRRLRPRRRPGAGRGDPELLFCENETNVARLFGQPPTTPWPKDGINDHVVSGAATVNPERHGHQGVGLVPRHRRARRDGGDPAPAAAQAAGPRPRPRGSCDRPARAVVRRHHGGSSGRGGRVLRRSPPARRDRRRGDDHAPGVRRDAVEQAVLRL